MMTIDLECTLVTLVNIMMITRRTTDLVHLLLKQLLSPSLRHWNSFTGLVIAIHGKVWMDKKEKEPLFLDGSVAQPTTRKQRLVFNKNIRILKSVLLNIKGRMEDRDGISTIRYSFSGRLFIKKMAGST